MVQKERARPLMIAINSEPILIQAITGQMSIICFLNGAHKTVLLQIVLNRPLLWFGTEKCVGKGARPTDYYSACLVPFHPFFRQRTR